MYLITLWATQYDALNTTTVLKAVKQFRAGKPLWSGGNNLIIAWAFPSGFYARLYLVLRIT